MYRNDMTPQEISTIMDSVSASLWRLVKEHKDSPMENQVRNAYKCAAAIDSTMCWLILKDK